LTKERRELTDDGRRRRPQTRTEMKTNRGKKENNMINQRRQTLCVLLYTYVYKKKNLYTMGTIVLDSLETLCLKSVDSVRQPEIRVNK